MKAWGQGFPNIKLTGINLNSISDHDNTTSSILSPSYERTEQREYIDLINMKRAIESLKQDNKRMREAINNLFSQIDHLNSIIYSLQDQMQINERSLFNINAQIKQLNFQIKQLHIRIRQASSRTYSIQQYQEQNIDIDEFQESKSTEQEIQRDKIQIENHEEKSAEKNEISAQKKDQLHEEQNQAQSHQEQDLESDKQDSKEETQVITEDQRQEKAEENQNDKAIEQDEEEEENTQRITLGNTVIYINPENPEDL